MVAIWAIRVCGREREERIARLVAEMAVTSAWKVLWGSDSGGMVVVAKAVRAWMWGGGRKGRVLIAWAARWRAMEKSGGGLLLVGGFGDRKGGRVEYRSCSCGCWRPYV